MVRRGLVGASAAAVLPSALAAAAFIGAPFAGTTTAPLAQTTQRPAHAHSTAATPSGSERAGGIGSGVDLIVGAEALCLALGVGVAVRARRVRNED